MAIGEKWWRKCWNACKRPRELIYCRWLIPVRRWLSTTKLTRNGSEGGLPCSKTFYKNPGPTGKWCGRLVKKLEKRGVLKDVLRGVLRGVLKDVLKDSWKGKERRYARCWCIRRANAFRRWQPRPSRWANLSAT